MRHFCTLVLALTLASCASSKEILREANPNIVPEGWIADYDGRYAINEYLSDQYQIATSSGLVAYVYFYSVTDDHCRHVRELMKHRHIKKAFARTRMIMLDFDRFQSLHKQNPEANINPGDWHPVITKISSDGHLTEKYIHPDIYLFHFNRIHDDLLRRRVFKTRHIQGLVEHEYAKRMREFFEDEDPPAK